MKCNFIHSLNKIIYVYTKHLKVNKKVDINQFSKKIKKNKIICIEE
jgi:hypothetical protein